MGAGRLGMLVQIAAVDERQAQQVGVFDRQIEPADEDLERVLAGLEPGCSRAATACGRSARGPAARPG